MTLAPGPGLRRSDRIESVSQWLFTEQDAPYQDQFVLRRETQAARAAARRPGCPARRSGPDRVAQQQSPGPGEGRDSVTPSLVVLAAWHCGKRGRTFEARSRSVRVKTVTVAGPGQSFQVSVMAAAASESSDSTVTVQVQVPLALASGPGH